MKVLISGGGTAGHVYPALALARALRSRFKDAELSYIGTSAGMESALVPAAGLSFYVVEAKPLPRMLSLDLLTAAFSNLLGLGGAFRLVRRLKPDVVVGMGAYASVPAAVAGILLRVPIVIHEQNATPGLANRLLSRFAGAVAVSYEKTGGLLGPRSVWTGNPVREEVLQPKREEALEALSLEPTRNTLLVFGGSRGARRINEAIAGAYGELREAGGLQIIHLAGRIEFEAVKECVDRQAKNGDALIYRLYPYLEEIGLAYACADLVLSRAGATTVAEVAARGVPALLVPYPHATGGHQEENAKALVEAGGARMIGDSELTPALLVGSLNELLGGRVLEGMAESSRRMGRPDAADRLAELVMKVAEGR